MGQCYRIGRTNAGGGDGQARAPGSGAPGAGAPGDGAAGDRAAGAGAGAEGSAVPPSGDGARREIKKFSLRQLKKATNNFNWDNCVGQGLYGCMLKGTLKKTGQVVAVRELYKCPQRESRFTAEVTMLTNLRHPNLVNFIGSCAKKRKRFVVYEYMPYRSLKDLLDATLNWSRRMKVAAGVATVLNYLHNEANPPVIFRGLKASNILLDEEFNPKLCDFAEAKFANDDNASSLPPTKQEYFTEYTAPESVNNGEYTTKSDVYNFGILILELISGTRFGLMTDGYREPAVVNRAREALASEQPGEVFGFADSRVRRNFEEGSIRRALALSLTCVSADPEARPNISAMVQEFNSLATEAFAHAVEDNDPVEADESPLSEFDQGGACAGNVEHNVPNVPSASRRAHA